MTARTEVREYWGLWLPEIKRLLESGYSDRPLTSEQDVLSDFSLDTKSKGYPVMYKRVTTEWLLDD